MSTKSCACGSSRSTAGSSPNTPALRRRRRDAHRARTARSRLGHRHQQAGLAHRSVADRGQAAQARTRRRERRHVRATQAASAAAAARRRHHGCGPRASASTSATPSATCRPRRPRECIALVAGFGYLGDDDRADEWFSHGWLDTPLELLAWLDKPRAQRAQNRSTKHGAA